MIELKDLDLDLLRLGLNLISFREWGRDIYSAAIKEVHKIDAIKRNIELNKKLAALNEKAQLEAEIMRSQTLENAKALIHKAIWGDK